MANQKRNRIKEARSYFRATEAVSKPIAFLMLFFALSFLVSVCVGLFLFGRWGYRQLTNVDRPTVVVSNGPVNESSVQISNSANGTDSNQSQTNQSNTTTTTSTEQASSTTVIPNTGSSPYIYLAILIIGTIAHSGYVRLRG